MQFQHAHLHLVEPSRFPPRQGNSFQIFEQLRRIEDGQMARNLWTRNGLEEFRQRLSPPAKKVAVPPRLKPRPKRLPGKQSYSGSNSGSACWPAPHETVAI